MNKKGLFGIPWTEMLSLTIFVLVLIVAIPIVIKGCSLMKKSAIDEQELNNFLILVEQINTLRVEDGEEVFPISIDKNFQIEVYSKCKKNQKPETSSCSLRPKICLRDTTNDKISPHCEYVENTDLEATGPLKAVNGLKLKKVEKDDRIITEVYT